MEHGRREFYLKTDTAPDIYGRMAVPEELIRRIAPGDCLWLIHDAARAYRVQSVAARGLILQETGIEQDIKRFAAPARDFGEVTGENGEEMPALPAMRPAYDLVPLFPPKPIAVEVEHRETGGPGEMIIELYDKEDPRPLRRSGDDDLDRLMADAFETLLRLQLKNLESTAEIGEMWIKYLKYKRGKG